jgi:hypothetical protein
VNRKNNALSHSIKQVIGTFLIVYCMLQCWCSESEEHLYSVPWVLSGEEQRWVRHNIVFSIIVLLKSSNLMWPSVRPYSKFYRRSMQLHVHCFYVLLNLFNL